MIAYASRPSREARGVIYSATEREKVRSMTQNKSSDQHRHVMPLPDIINRPDDPASVQAKPWHVHHDANGLGATDLANRQMYAPLGESDEDFAVRAHEMLHVKWSPLPSGDPLDVYALAAEDGRIESLGTKHGIQRPETHPGKSVAAELLAKGEFAAGMCCAVAVVGSPGEQVTRDALTKLGATEALELMDYAAEQYAADETWGSTEAVASRLREVVSAAEEGESGESEDEPGMPDDSDESGEAEGESGDGESMPSAKPKPVKPREDKPKESKPEFKPADLPAHAPRPASPDVTSEPKPSEPARPTATKRRDTKAKADDLGEAMPVDMAELTADMPIAEEIDWRKFDRSGGCDTWSKPSMSIPPRPIILTQDEKGRKRSRSTDYGTVPTRMHRAAVDDRVFTARKHKRQGTVLVDMSGSMSIDSEQIKALIDHAPAAVIAGYWGCSGTGVLRILASGGRMVSESALRPSGHGNEIDGPALAWLARQRAPRIWVCDDKLTGTEDLPVNKDLRAFCERIIRQSRIRRIGSMKDLDAIKRWLR